jgi:flagellar biosynthesis/type III secretory pathway M-ring protein FliF/YscJ
MDINTRIERDPVAPFYYRPLVWFLEMFPPLNSIKGIMAYTFVIYLIMTIVRIIFVYFSKEGSDDEKSKKSSKEQIEFEKKLAETRKIRGEEADKLLKKLYN